MDLLFLKPRKSDEAGPWEHCPGAHTRTAFAGFCVDRVHVYKPIDSILSMISLSVVTIIVHTCTCTIIKIMINKL